MISLATAYVVKKELFFIKVEEFITVMVIQLEMLLEYLLVFLKMTVQQVNKFQQTTITNNNNKLQQQTTNYNNKLLYNKKLQQQPTTTNNNQQTTTTNYYNKLQQQ